jgi:rhomboid protease GluP
MFGEKKKLVMCQACRALVDPSEKVCPMCGNESVPEERISTTGESGNFFSMLIIGINILIFILMGVVGLKSGRGLESFIASASGTVLDDFGSFDIYLVNRGEWWRFVTPNFLHIGLIHLLFNSYALYQVGPLVEEIYGEQKFIFIYILTGIFCWIPSYYAGIQGAGASGAISGLIGLMAVYGYRQGGTFGKALMKSMLTWMAMTIAYGFIIGANNVAHAGGFIAGGILGFLIKGEPVGTKRAKTIWNALALASILIFAVSFALVGKNYGAVEETSKKGDSIIRLSRLVREAGQELDQTIRSSDKDDVSETTKTSPKDNVNGTAKPSQKDDLNAAAKNLQRLASDITSIQKIDDRSDEIRSRLVQALNRSTEAMANGSKNSPQTIQTLLSEMTEYAKVYNEYVVWEDSVLTQYGLFKPKKESQP